MTHASARMESRRARVRWLRVAGVLFGLVLLWMAFRDIDLLSLRQTLASASVSWMVLTALLVACGLMLKAWRWRVLLKPVAPEIGFWDCLGLLLAGQVGNALLPWRSGDLLRSTLASAGAASRLPAVVTGVVVEKGLDAVSFLALFALALTYLPGGPLVETRWGEPLAIGLGGLGMALFVLRFSLQGWRKVRPWVARLPGRVGRKAVALGDQFVCEFERLRQRGRFLSAFLLTVAIWLVMVLTNLTLAASLGLPSSVELGVIVVLLALAAVAPGLMPGHVGPFYFFVASGLRALGIDEAGATAYAVLLHLMVMVPPFLGAGLYFVLPRFPWIERRTG